MTSESKYKIKFTLLYSVQDIEDLIETEICVRILKVNDNTVCVEFKKLNGDQMKFYEHFNEFSKILYKINDVEIN